MIRRRFELGHGLERQRERAALEMDVRETFCRDLMGVQLNTANLGK